MCSARVQLLYFIEVCNSKINKNQYKIDRGLHRARSALKDLIDKRCVR